MVHTNSDSAKREKEAVTFAIRVRTMWHEENKVSNFDSGGSKIERNIAKLQIFATLCPERSVGTSLWPRPKIKKFRSKYDSLYATNFTPTLAYFLWYLVP